MREKKLNNYEKRRVAYPKLDVHKSRVSPVLHCSKDYNGNNSSENEAVPDEVFTAMDEVITSMADVSAIMNDNMGSEIDGLSSIPESMSEREDGNGSVSIFRSAHGTLSDILIFFSSYTSISLFF